MDKTRINVKLTIVSWIFIIFFKATGSHCSPVLGPEHKLYMHLFADYTSDSRPVKNASHAVVVNFDLSLNQLLDLDEKNQILTTSVWIYEEWTDEMLKWSPTDYDGQQAIMIPANSIWLPDIFIFNTANANMNGFVNVNGSKVAIQYDGKVRWMVPLMVSSVCAVDVTYFPYDRQTCKIKFGSWIYDINQLEIMAESTKPDLEHYVMNSEYDLRNVSISWGILDNSCCPGDGHHSMVELKIELGRKSLYYDYIVIAPTIMLCVLTLASFLLPCDRGEKMAIGLTVFLTLYVLQLRIADNVPDTNSTPILGVFLLIVMTFNCVSLIMATIVMNIKKRGDDSPCPTVPSWLLWLCHNIFGSVVCTKYLWKDEIPFPGGEKQAVEFQNKYHTVSSPPTASSENCTHGHHTSKQKGKQGERGMFPSDHVSACSLGGEYNRDLENNDESDAQMRNLTSSCALKPAGQVRQVNPPAGNKLHASRNTPQSQREKDTQMRLRKPRSNPSHNAESSQREFHGTGSVGQLSISKVGGNASKSYLMKRRWFYVAEVVDKFLFLVYLVLLTFSIFTVLFLIPVYFRND